MMTRMLGLAAVCALAGMTVASVPATRPITASGHIAVRLYMSTLPPGHQLNRLLNSQPYARDGVAVGAAGASGASLPFILSIIAAVTRRNSSDQRRTSTMSVGLNAQIGVLLEARLALASERPEHDSGEGNEQRETVQFIVVHIADGLSLPRYASCKRELQDRDSLGVETGGRLGPPDLLVLANGIPGHWLPCGAFFIS